ncbi:aldehyde dehydrogenase family protein [Streptomyces sp. NBS 14/10]|uniref:aldehyde dehydrogenase family protein n=1 Tax=Streptomyces sp. NBS 14/10 TaxID=1945643 RepID=UPI001C531AC2|nr:aldehyde dehydrogenase family protein [Streptomyces sp. NBS 14/10]KAK1184242.1 aldehyde dehydrogenase family protein [Streptomyces sp. NBS 14/10]
MNENTTLLADADATGTTKVSDDAAHRDRTIVNPATGAVIRTVADNTAAEVDEAVRAAKAAFESGPWPRMPRSERARHLLRFADAIEAHTEVLFQLETRNNGRPITETRAQLSRVPEWFRYNAGLLATQRDAVLPGDGPYLTYQRRSPLGVCGIITPFNHPLLILARSLSAALATGNTVVVKPSEMTPLTTLALVDILREAGLPEGVVGVVTGGREVGERLTGHPDIAKITLTGGTEAGRAAAVATAARFARVTAELGGKTPIVVFDDIAPVVAAEGAAFAAFVAAGQSCVAGSRFLVQRGIYDEFVEALSARASAIRIGDPVRPETQLGPLISGVQRDKVLRLISTGIQEGVRVAAGGGVPDLPAELGSGYYLQPTVLADATMSMTVAREEIFGPVAVVVPFDGEDDAVAMANDNRFGLGAGVWTRDIARGHRVADRITAGMVWVNDHHRLEPSLPWGGVKESGTGRDAGQESFDDFTWIKTVVVRTAADDVDWYGHAEPGRLN